MCLELMISSESPGMFKLFLSLSFCSTDYHLVEQRSNNNSPDLVHEILHNPVKVKLRPRVARIHVGHLCQGEHSSGDPEDKSHEDMDKGRVMPYL